eukprot:gene821-2548_t
MRPSVGRLCRRMIGKPPKKGPQRIHATTQALKQCAKSMDTQKAREVFDGLKGSGLAPNVYVYNSLISVYGKSSEPDRAFQVFEEMMKSGVSPNTVTFNTLMTAYEKGPADGVAKAFSVYSQMKSSGQRPTRVTLPHHFHHLATEALADMKKAGYHAGSLEEAMPAALSLEAGLRHAGDIASQPVPPSAAVSTPTIQDALQYSRPPPNVDYGQILFSFYLTLCLDHLVALLVAIVVACPHRDEQAFSNREVMVLLMQASDQVAVWNRGICLLPVGFFVLQGGEESPSLCVDTFTSYWLLLTTLNKIRVPRNKVAPCGNTADGSSTEITPAMHVTVLDLVKQHLVAASKAFVPPDSLSAPPSLTQ